MPYHSRSGTGSIATLFQHNSKSKKHLKGTVRGKKGNMEERCFNSESVITNEEIGSRLYFTVLELKCFKERIHFYYTLGPMMHGYSQMGNVSCCTISNASLFMCEIHALSVHHSLVLRLPPCSC